MATKKSFKVYKAVSKTENKKTVIKLQEVKTDGTEETAKNAAHALKKAGVNYLELVNTETNEKTTYKKSISGNNYEVKLLKITEK